jgi:cytochrome c oxidase subunit 3/cytochrome c oxidase subunit I+III
MVLLIATEATLFSSLIASYFYLRLQVGPWPPPGVPKPSIVLPLAFTAMLVAGAMPMLGAVRASRRGRRAATWWLIAAAFCVQATYLGLQVHLFVIDLNEFSPRDTAYGSIYFALLGIHHAHVAVGLALEAWLLAVLARGLTNYRLIAVRVVALYTYFVALIAIPVVLTQLSPSL